MFCLFVPCLSLLLQLGVCTLWGKGAHSSSRFFCLFAALKDFESGILMPSGLLVWQIPYREMRSLGLKVVSAVGVACPVLCCVVLWGLVATRSWSVPSLTVRVVFSWT